MEQKKAKILYVEDDLALSYVTKDNLELRGYEVAFEKDGKSGLNAFSHNDFDLCLLDVMLPEMDGFTLATKIRKKDQNIPIIFLTAKSMKEDKIAGLTLGADDYITKPFSIQELVLKIEIFLKRSRIIEKKIDSDFISNIGNYTFNYSNQELKIEKEIKRLTIRETDLLKLFIENKNQILKKEIILHKVWGDDSYLNSRSLDVFVSKLRKYLKSDPRIKINNIHGIGFILTIENS